ncbi:hypothetical protein K505DRAFT_263974 [Melanomma pulvis-pyrius CBS 109.77]|uniref:F-box domain-containing protein n=1 Tax=Melanomma pulvis-pyrius CBS 109.77 TaxID=1314802 RepID=A0A6A6XVZ3_9PLEO|nr:hypothetical protein K505DRAFT_263974 [Melanomma pulvis-pyrius CBS 109.77]
MATQQQQSRFLSLPTELIIDVVSYLSDDCPALVSLACTCRRLQPLAEELIYAVIELRSTDDLHDLLNAFSRRFERIAAVRTLKILYEYHPSLATTVEERNAFNACLGEMKGLKDWHVESPYDNYKWTEGGNEWVEQDMESFRTALEKVSYSLGQSLQVDLGLAQLNKLILHSHGATSDFWDLGGFHCLFRHPSLRYLHVSCLSLPADIPELAQFSSTTPLTTLIFDECDIKPSSLRCILATPKSLKHLTLGENVFNIHGDRGITPRLSRAPHASLQALLPVAHSLESLTHYDPIYSTLPDPERPVELKLDGDGMRNFPLLTYLECDPCSFLYRGIILAPTLAPPNLATLRIHRPRRQVGNFFEELPDFTPYTRLGSLNTLEFVQPTSIKLPTHLAECVCEAERLRERHAIGYKLHRHGVNLKMYMEIHESGGLIPPYLHGEPTPKTVCLYDAAEVGFSRKIEDNLPDKSIVDKNVEEPLPETDQLGKFDIICLKNEVRMAIFHETLIDDTDMFQHHMEFRHYLIHDMVGED